MIDYESSLRTHLLDDNAITDIIGDRAFPLFLPQGAPLPAIVWIVDGKDRAPRNGGGLVESFLDMELILEAEPANYSVGQDLSEAVRNRIDMYKGDLSNEFNIRGIILDDEFKSHLPPTDGKGSGTIVFTLEFTIWFREVATANIV